MTFFLSLLAPGFETPYSPVVFLGLLALLGFVIGILTGLFGVGGGFLVVPLLNVLLGVPYGIAVGSSLCFILGTSSLALPGHVKKGNVEPLAVLYLSVGSALGALAGDWLQDFLVFFAAGGDKTIFVRLMHGLFIVLLLLTAALLVKNPSKAGAGPKPLQRLPLPPRVNFDRSKLTDVSIPGLIAIGFLVGVLTGLLGIGGGVLFMPLLLLVVGLEPKQAVGTSLGVVMAASLAGAAKKLLSDEPKISLVVIVGLFAGSFLGVKIGVRLCEVLHGGKIRNYFVAVILAALAVIVYDLLR